ncbi:hypothetical protein LSH36_500g03031 [Paralvinella palmiformis]|uniref:Uncharacterized protein n=1 Tax=Paralvinella palmiformis TaxID=53620 RepID=A0AAD9MWK0_9ANNE|nr:hypothetical protein LSH36_500g03031 [Paralvinella palmiformis]
MFEDFEGVISGDNPSSGTGHLPSPETFDHYTELINSSLLHFYQYERPTLGHYENVQRYKAAAVPVVSFIYRVSEPDSLANLIDTSNKRQARWMTKMEDTSSRIEKEREQNGDLLIVDVVDTYRNITQKLLQAFIW